MAYELDRPALPADSAFDPGLRAFLSRIYLKVAGGLVLSAAMAWAVARVSALRDLFFVTANGEATGFSGWGLVLVFSPLVVLLLAPLIARDQTARISGFLYWTIAALVGASLSLLVLAYTAASLVSAFLITACAFGGLSLWGYVTKRNLSGFGNFLTVALFGLILALVLNLFLRSPVLELALDLAGVLIFSGLVAADTQRLKLIYYHVGDEGELRAAGDYGALSLYLNFVNLFQLILSLGGSDRR